MEFEWDEAKSSQCFKHRGFDFVYVAHAFLDSNRVIRADRRYEYGEERLQMLGQVQGRLFHVVFTMRGAAIRIISARKANLREVNDYENGAFQA
jgi:uncharacterized protein